MRSSTLLQIGAIGAAVALIITAELIADPTPRMIMPPDTPRLGPPVLDPLPAALARCSSLGAAAENDTSCQRAWVLNRERFLGLNPAEDASDAALDAAANSADADTDLVLPKSVDGVTTRPDPLARPASPPPPPSQPKAR